MAKRARVRRSGKHRECMNAHCSTDRISMLPDGVLVHILCFLTLKEAAATSILSRRWLYLWSFVPKLDFDGTEFLLKLMYGGTKSESTLEDERWNYVGWVDDVIALHKSSTVEELRVYFNLNKTQEKCIYRWLVYALARKVQRLELNLTDERSKITRHYDECYTFPYELLCTDTNFCSNRLRSWSMRQCNSTDFRNLREISTNYVNVNGEALEFFLCNCPLLEQLSVSQSGELTTLRITGPFPAFKRLEISLCHNLNSVEIRDTNLVYLKYRGARIHFLLENVPLLVDLFVGGVLTDRVGDVHLLFASILPQLEVLTVDVRYPYSWRETETFRSAVTMSNLKKMLVKAWVKHSESLMPITNLIRAAPRLQRFVLEAMHTSSQFVERNYGWTVRPFPQLKAVEFVGYRGVTAEHELLMHLLENAVALEEILVDPRERKRAWNHVRNRYCEINKTDVEDEMNARARAKKQLRRKVPKRINLQIL